MPPDLFDFLGIDSETIHEVVIHSKNNDLPQKMRTTTYGVIINLKTGELVSHIIDSREADVSVGDRVQFFREERR